MFFEMRFDLGTLDSGERSLPFGLLVSLCIFFDNFFSITASYLFRTVLEFIKQTLFVA